VWSKFPSVGLRGELTSQCGKRNASVVIRTERSARSFLRIPAWPGTRMKSVYSSENVEGTGVLRMNTMIGGAFPLKGGLEIFLMATLESKMSKMFEFDVS